MSERDYDQTAAVERGVADGVFEYTPDLDDLGRPLPPEEPKQTPGFVTSKQATDTRPGFESSTREEVEAVQMDPEVARQLNWGGDAARNGELARAAVVHLDQQMGGQVKAFLESTGLGDHPVAIAFFHRLGEIFESQAQGRPVEGVASEQAQREIKRVMADTSGPYWNPDHPEHKAAVKRVQALYARAFERK